MIVFGMWFLLIVMAIIVLIYLLSSRDPYSEQENAVNNGELFISSS
ncbi:MAG: hypothetical protein ACFFDT_32560 [Candidatus Hodarchaeota archaeon]